jgi:hypothetical protein
LFVGDFGLLEIGGIERFVFCNYGIDSGLKELVGVMCPDEPEGAEGDD